MSNTTTVEWVKDTASGKDYIRVWIEKKLSIEAIAEAVDLAKHEVAKKIWEENSTQIMAQMDLKGLAALVAIEASKALKK